MKRLAALALGCISLLFIVGGCQVVDSIVRSFIFFPESAFLQEPQDVGLTSQTVELTTADGAKLHSWYLPAPGATQALLFIHGNAGNISHRLFMAAGWVERGVSVFLLDYRGFGKSEGTLTEETDLYTDVRTAYEWLRTEQRFAPRNIILCGESIGAAGAVELGTQEAVGAVLLIAPFTTLSSLAKHHYGAWIPGALVGKFAFHNEAKIALLKAPLFIMHGTRDEVVPHEMGERLFELAREPKEALWVKGGGHNDLPDVAGAAFWDRPHAFIQQHSVEV